MRDTISLATEQHLREAHYLLAAKFENGGPIDTFGTSATIMILLSIAAASAIQSFSLDRNRNARQDGQSFIECVEKYFPWEHVSVADGEHRPSNQISQIAARELYEVFRNPLVHSGGVVAKRYGRRVAFIAHPYPGAATYKENETRIAEICKLDSYKNQRLLDIMADKSVVHTHPLYWCTRKMIEAFAADVSVQASIAESMGYT